MIVFVKHLNCVLLYAQNPTELTWFKTLSRVIELIYPFKILDNKRALEKKIVRTCVALVYLKFQKKVLKYTYKKNGQPYFAQPFLGSISHSQDKYLVVMGPNTPIGCDIEHWLTLPRSNRLAAKIMTRHEFTLFENSKMITFEKYVTFIFSAKESIYKYLAHYNLTATWQEASLIDLNWELREFRYELSSKFSNELPKLILVGYFAVSCQMILTLISEEKDV